MAFTPAEEARLRALMGQDASLLTLASNEPAIIQELGAQDVTIQDLQLASSLLPTDKILGRFGGDDKSALLSSLAEFVKSILKLNRLDYGAPLIGSLIYWPIAQMPQEIWPDMNMEFIPYMQQAFDQTKYPLLKALHPSGVLPADARGEFIRGWDNGRGVDAGRVIMSKQDASIVCAGDVTSQYTTLPSLYNSVDDDSVKFKRLLGSDGTPAQIDGIKSVSVNASSTSNDMTQISMYVRPRSIAVNVITRAK